MTPKHEHDEKVVPMKVVGSTERSGGDPTGGPEHEKAPKAPDPEILDKPVRRQFTAEYKLRIIQELDACEVGEKGQLLRREGLYQSQVSAWRRSLREDGLKGLTPKRRGRKVKPAVKQRKEIEKLKRENLRLKEQLRKAEIIIDVQKKTSELLGIELQSPPWEERND